MQYCFQLAGGRQLEGFHLALPIMVALTLQAGTSRDEGSTNDQIYTFHFYTEELEK